jgi:ribosomal protein S18 acetylase RimI-like enzyme
MPKVRRKITSGVALRQMESDVLTQAMRSSAGSRSSSVSVTPGARLGAFPPVGAGQPFHHGAMSTYQYRIRRAERADIPAILDLIGSTAKWLQACKDTDQWARPWPDEERRDIRVEQGILDGLTWIVEDSHGMLAATVTCREHGNETLWTDLEMAEKAAYVSRLIVSRDLAGHGIGAALINWTGLHGAREWGAKWIRVDVWTTNLALHDYYRGQGFEHLRTLDFEDYWEYPSAALFQKPMAAVDKNAEARFESVEEAS